MNRITKKENIFFDPSTYHAQKINFDIKDRLQRVEVIKQKDSPTIYAVKETLLPAVRISLILKSGNILDPDKKEGLAYLTTRLLRTAGAGDLSAEDFDQAVEDIGANISVDVGTDITWINARALSDDFEKIVTLLKKMVTEPRFEEPMVKIEKNLYIEQLIREKDSHTRLLMREFKKAVYRGTALGRYPTPDNVSKIERKDIVDFYNRFIKENIFGIVVSGALKDQDIDLLKRAFDGMYTNFVKTDLVKNTSTKGSIFVFVPKDLSQTGIAIGRTAPVITSNDYFVLRVLDEILGGGFSSRLYMHLRAQRGLAYSVGSFYRAGNFNPGIFASYIITRNQQSVNSFKGLVDELKALIEKGVVDDELNRAKEAIVRRFVFKGDSWHKIAILRAKMDLLGLKDDFFENYISSIENVTKDEILKAARKYLDIKRLSAVITGGAVKSHKDEFERYFKSENIVIVNTKKSGD